MCFHGKGSYWRCANHIGVFLVLLFAVCFLWFYINPVEQDLHLRLFRLSFIGYSGMNVASFILGAVQAYIWAYVAAGLWLLAGTCCKGGKCEMCGPKGK